MIKEILRKGFHLLGLLYVWGLLVLPRSQFLLLLGGLLVVQGLIEAVRLTNPKVNGMILLWFGDLIRPKEEHSLSGVFWMMLGVWITVFLLEPVRLSITAILFLVLGDGVASLAGKAIKGPTWWKSEKRLSGSAACFLMCLLVATLTLRPEFAWSGILAAALIATLIEVGWIPGNDNVLIPVTSALGFLVFYGGQI